MPNTEDIEAKLCAYVDGELDEAGRGEIERHLTTNPQHRKLIDELTRQRDLLRALPRSRAPVDIAETLNAQLERSALLSEDDWRDQPIRLSHWPQIRAAAALLLLVFGLAAVVYYVVPSPNQSNPSIVFNAPTADDVRPTEAGAPTTGPAGVSGGTVFTATGNPDPDMGTFVRQDRLALLVPETLRDSIISNALAPQIEMMRDAFASSPSKRSEVKVIIAAADVDEARRHVKDYLDQRGVRLEAASGDAPAHQSLSIDLSQHVLGARRQQTPQVQMREQTHEQTREQTQDTAFIPDLPAAVGAAGGVAPDKDKDQLDPAPIATAEARIEAPAEQTYSTRLPRRKVAEFCRGISNQLAGRVARVVEEPTDASPSSDPSSFAPVTIGDWSGLFPWLARTESSAAAHERRLGFAAPAHALDADEEVDVLIVVRPDAALLKQQQRAVSQDVQDPAAPAPDDSSPTTSPATGPSQQ